MKRPLFATLACKKLYEWEEQYTRVIRGSCVCEEHGGIDLMFLLLIG
jgi:hypothetical protein